MSIFIAKRLDKDHTLYISRNTGKRYLLSPDYAEYGNHGYVVTSDNLEILGSNRAQLMSLIEIADKFQQEEGGLCSQ